MYVLVERKINNRFFYFGWFLYLEGETAYLNILLKTTPVYQNVNIKNKKRITYMNLILNKLRGKLFP